MSAVSHIIISILLVSCRAIADSSPSDIDQNDAATPITQQEVIKSVGVLDHEAVGLAVPSSPQKLYEDRLSSVFKLDILPCSGTFVSDSGYAVSALHCLPDYPFEIDHVTEDDGVLAAIRALAKEEVSTTKFLPQTFLEDLESDQVEVILLGSGYPGAFPEIHHSPGLRQRYAAKLEDFVIVKFDKRLEGHKCAPIDRNFVAAGQRVWQVGYPNLKTQKALDLEKLPKSERDVVIANMSPKQKTDVFMNKFVSTGNIFRSFHLLNDAAPHTGLEAPLLDSVFIAGRYLASTSAVFVGMSVWRCV